MALLNSGSSSRRERASQSVRDSAVAVSLLVAVLLSVAEFLPALGVTGYDPVVKAGNPTAQWLLLGLLPLLFFATFSVVGPLGLVLRRPWGFALTRTGLYAVAAVLAVVAVRWFLHDFCLLAGPCGENEGAGLMLYTPGSVLAVALLVWAVVTLVKFKEK